MTRDMETLRMWATVGLIIAAICTTAFPIIYMFARWYETRLGRALMLQAWAFALALDFTLLLTFWQPEDILVVFWINAFVFVTIAMATSYLTWKMLKHNLVIPLRDRHKENSS